MSAFVVSDKHITELVKAALRAERSAMGVYHEGARHDVDCTNAEEWANRLKAENHRSVHARYPDTIEDRENTPGVIGEAGEPWAGDFGIVHSILGTPLLPDSHGLSPVEALKAIDCYIYQSCEHDGWEASLAHSFCLTLQSRLIGMLPGYDDAPWGIPA